MSIGQHETITVDPIGILRIEAISIVSMSFLTGLKKAIYLMNLLKRTWAAGARPMGAPGWPELAWKVASTYVVVNRFVSSSIYTCYAVKIGLRSKTERCGHDVG